MSRNNFYSIVKGKKLRNGYTTGSCAAGAAGAAASVLITGVTVESVYVETPAGVGLSLDIADCIINVGSVKCSIIKDSGDDPDVTDGIKIWAEATKICNDIIIEGGEGVGRITRAGLSGAIGEAAINPVPRKMIYDSVKAVANKHGYSGGLNITVSAENGAEIAKRTFNARLGIIGGISILGTSGIVEPMSEKALIDTIRLEIDTKAATGITYLLICLGNYGRDFAFAEYGIDIDKGVKCSNYIGEALDYAAYKNIKNILVIGHSGKLVKLGGGIMNTHSKMADCRCEIFAAHAALSGASKCEIERIMDAVSTDEIDDLLADFGIKEKVWESIIKKISFHVAARLGGRAKVEFIVFTNKRGALQKTDDAEYFINKIKKGI